MFNENDYLYTNANGATLTMTTNDNADDNVLVAAVMVAAAARNSHTAYQAPHQTHSGKEYVWRS